MAAMYGSNRLTSGASGLCGCCGAWHGKEQIKGREERQWRREALEEMTDPAHANGICSDPKTGMAGCWWCYAPDDYEANDNSDLDDIPGVWCDLDWRTA